jgi:hypothetical protein
MNGIEWPETIVAALLIVLVGTVAVTAIIRHPVRQALQVWSALSVIVGVITGTIVIYFFTRDRVQAAMDTAAGARELAANRQQALIKLIESIPPEKMSEMRKDPLIVKAFEPTDVRALATLPSGERPKGSGN